VNAQPPASTIQQALAGRRVLVTGHTGFKGAWLSAWLLQLGAEVAGYALEPPTTPSLFEAIALERSVDHRIGDVRDLNSVCRRVEEVDPHVVVHMAAQALVRDSYDDPVTTFDTNVMGTVHVLEALRRRGRPAVAIVVTSDKCYRNLGERHEFREADPMGGHDPYSASKGATELAVAAYRHSHFPVERYEEHGVGLASVRAGNVIGGGDWASHRIVPDVVRAVLADEAPVLRYPDAVRPWQHVLDALSGYLWLAAQMIRRGAEGLAEAWNFGPVDRETLTVGQLTERVLHAWGRGEWVRGGSDPTAREATYLRLDCSKAVEQLGWVPLWNVDESIERTVAWYRAERDGADMAELTARQIREHSEQARGAGRVWASPGAIGPR
jgi:CDP-glucose 4,6-dehydratase